MFLTNEEWLKKSKIEAYTLKTMRKFARGRHDMYPEVLAAAEMVVRLGDLFETGALGLALYVANGVVSDDTWGNPEQVDRVTGLVKVLRESHEERTGRNRLCL
jgi:hypothetical protein